MNRQSYGQISKGIQYENLVTFPEILKKERLHITPQTSTVYIIVSPFPKINQITKLLFHIPHRPLILARRASAAGTEDLAEVVRIFTEAGGFAQLIDLDVGPFCDQFFSAVHA